MSSERERLLANYMSKYKQHEELEKKTRSLRLNLRELEQKYEKTEDHLKALQSIGWIVAEVLKEIDPEKYIVKASSGPRYVVGVKSKLDKSKLKVGSRVTLDMTTLTIMRVLPREVDPMVYHMLNEDPGQIDFSDIGGLGD